MASELAWSLCEGCSCTQSPVACPDTFAVLLFGLFPSAADALVNLKFHLSEHEAPSTEDTVHLAQEAIP